jgi:hypothetical protein
MFNVFIFGSHTPENENKVMDLNNCDYFSLNFSRVQVNQGMKVLQRMCVSKTGVTPAGRRANPLMALPKVTDALVDS